MKVSVEFICLAHEVVKLYGSRLDDLASSHGLTSAEMNVLWYMHSGGCDTARDISEGRCMSKASVSKAVDSLRQKGYLKEKVDKNDRRIVHLTRTQEAEKLVSSVCAQQEKVMDELLAGVSEEEMQQLEIVIRKLKNNLCGGNCDGRS